MAFMEGAYATVWSIEDKGKYAWVQLSTSKKVNDGFVTDFSGRVSFLGDAKDRILSLARGTTIKLIKPYVTTNKKGNKFYTNFAVSDFEIIPKKNGESTEAGESFFDIPTGMDDMPFC